MEYFLMSQDTDFQHVVSLKQQEIPEAWLSLRGIERRLYPSAEQFSGRNYNILVQSDKRNLYLDFLEFPLPLLSTQLKDVFISYLPELPCSCVLLSDRELRQQHTYWIFELACLECLADSTELYPDGTFKKMVLDECKIKENAIFRASGITHKPVIIRKDVAESILRRSMLGIKLECVEVGSPKNG